VSNDAGLQPAKRYDWERIVRRCRIPGPTKLVAYTLAQYGNPDGTQIRPGVARLAAVCGMGESTARRHVDRLLALGLLQRSANGGGRNGVAARYRLTVPEDLLERVELLPPEEVTPPTQVSGEAPVENLLQRSPERAELPSELRSPGDELRSLRHRTPLTLGPNSAHPGERLPTDQGDQTSDQTRSPQLGTSPAQRPGECDHGIPIGQMLGANLACGDCRRAVRAS
jgi:hypothetical protein